MPDVRGALPLLKGVTADAIVSDCGTYRYALTRWWDDPSVGHNRVLWIMLNPSIAAADVDDRTVRTCQKYAKAWGYSGITVVNLFALRATKPKDLRRHPLPVGPDNDATIASMLAWQGDHPLVIAAWGIHGRLYGRDAVIMRMAKTYRRDLHVVSLTKDGYPGHPLYVKDTATPVLWKPARS